MMKTNRSMHSTKSLSYVTDAAFDVDESDFNFEEMLASTCLKFNCPYPIIVRKEYRQDAHLKLLKHSDKNVFNKINLKMPMIERSTVQRLKNIGAEDVKLTDYDEVSIVVTSVYDALNRLITLAIVKAHKIPRVLIQSIGLLAPNFDTLNNITLTKCGMDGQVVYELFNILPKTNITEICLDQSPIKEGNYALLLEVPSHLRNLSLCRCRINDAVVQQIAECLHYPLPAAQTLQVLNLASNDIGDEGARLLADALRTNRRLRYLNLSDNHITDNGASYLLNTLEQFPLTTDELLKKRLRFLDYLKTRMELCMKFMYDFGDKEFDEISLSSGNLPGRRSQVGRARKRSSASSVKHTKTMRHKSSQSESYLPMPGKSSKYLMNRAESLAGETLGPFVDPFSPNHITMKTEWPYCHGNFTLSYLNLAYNSLSFMTIRKLHKLVSYQSGKMNPHECGLLKIVIEGNKLPENGKELEEIKQLLQKNMSRYMGTGTGKSSDRKKSRTARISSVRGKHDVLHSP